MTETVLTGTTPVVAPVVATLPVTSAEPPKVEDKGTPQGVTDDKTKAVETPKEAVVEFKSYELKAPDGVELSPEGLKAFNEFAVANKLPEGTAKQIAEWYGKHASEAAKAQATHWQSVNDGWVKAAKEDTEYGGDKFDNTVTAVKGLIGKFGGKEFTDMLNATGAGNHPEMIRFLNRVNEATKEDKQVTVGANNGSKPDLAKRLFPNQN